MPLARALPLILLMSVATSADAHATSAPEADPALYLQAFNETCRRGFPDLDAIAQAAVAHGWIERTIRPADGAADILSATLPRVLTKGEMIVFLTAPDIGEFRSLCQITGTGHRTSLSGKDIAAVLSPSLNVGEPVPGAGTSKEDDYALWTVKPGMTVLAGISAYRKRTRSISISVRQAR